MVDYCPECGSDQWDGKHCCPACGFLHRNEEIGPFEFVVESIDLVDDEEFPNTEGENDHRTKFTYPKEGKQYEEQE